MEPLVENCPSRGGEEKQKYRNYKKIADLEERKKYTPVDVRYTSGKGTKRTFGNSTRSNKG